MEKRTFGRTGFQVGVVGFGGAPIGILETEQQQVGAILNRLLDEGVNVIDTAAGYAGSEEAIGKAVAHRRGEYVLVSKCGAWDEPNSDAWRPTALTAAVDRSLSRLRTDHLDVMLLHSGGLDVLTRGDAVEALVRARDAGKIRHIGYSGDNEAASYAAALPDIDVLETSINICDQENIEIVLPEARAHNVGVIAKRPIANAAWKKPSEQPGFYEHYTRFYSDRLARMNIAPADFGFSNDDPSAWPEIALRFTLSHEGVHTAIIGTTNIEHALGNLALAAKGPLPQDAIEKFREAFHTAESACGRTWVGQT